MISNLSEIEAGTTDPAKALPQEPWYVLRVRSNCEKKVSDGLISRGVEEFLPTYRCRSYWSDRVKWIDRPLFSGYVFCRLGDGPWSRITQVPGVIGPVSFGSRPAPVDFAEMAALRKMVGSSAPLFPVVFLRTGQRVMVKRGPLAGLEGILERIGKDCRVLVSVSLLHRSVAAEVDAEWVVPIPEARISSSRLEASRAAA